MKRGVLVNAEKLDLWQCCGRFYSPGITRCVICGRRRAGGNRSGRCPSEPERGKSNALVAKASIEEVLPGLAGRFRVTIERHGPRLLDDDNFAGGSKQLRDAIAELLGKKGDSLEDGVEFCYRQVKSKMKKTVIRVQQIKQGE